MYLAPLDPSVKYSFIHRSIAFIHLLQYLINFLPIDTFENWTFRQCQYLNYKTMKNSIPFSLKCLVVLVFSLFLNSCDKHEQEIQIAEIGENATSKKNDSKGFGMNMGCPGSPSVNNCTVSYPLIYGDNFTTWHFGDGTSMTSRSGFSYQYLSNGTYTITSNSGCSFTVTISNCAASASDFDNDGIVNSADNCPTNFNPNQADQDRDSIGDICDTFNCSDLINDNWSGIIIRDGFSPNGDKIHEIFKPEYDFSKYNTPYNARKITMEITAGGIQKYYEVYRPSANSTGTLKGWDGTSNGQIAIDGYYRCTLKVESCYGTRTFSKFIWLIR